MTTMSREVKIKEIAYGLWEQEGRPNGRDLEHYFRAEQLISNVPAPAGAAAPKAATARARKPKPAVPTRKPAARKASAGS